MGLLDKKKRKQPEYRDQYFIFAGRWFEKFEEDRFTYCRPVEDISEIPDAYLEDWKDWKPKPINKEKLGLSYYSSRTGKLF
jgi:hypothetical protein